MCFCRILANYVELRCDGIYHYSQTVLLGYGLTETTGAITRTTESSPPGTVGEVVPTLELKVDIF